MTDWNNKEKAAHRRPSLLDLASTTADIPVDPAAGALAGARGSTCRVDFPDLETETTQKPGASSVQKKCEGALPPFPFQHPFFFSSLFRLRFRILAYMRAWSYILGLFFCLGLWHFAYNQGFAPSDSLKNWKKVNLIPALPRREAGILEDAFQGKVDSTAFEKARADAESALSSKGYLEASVDSIREQGKKLHVFLHLGPRYVYDSLRLENLELPQIEDAGFPRLVRKHEPLNRKDLERRFAAILDEYQNQGYPFAKFDSLEAWFTKRDSQTIGVSLRYAFDPGPPILIDTVLISGDHRETTPFILNMIDIHPGDPYRNNKVAAVPQILNNSIYFKNVRPVEVAFTTDRKARLTVKVDSRRAGRFDLLLGVLPPAQGTASAKLQFTGLADIQLVSPIFRAGEILQFRYDKLPGASQKMHLQYQHPNLFGTPVRIQPEFDLLKQDTIFLTRTFRFAAFYSVSQHLALKFFYKNKVSSLLSAEPFALDSTRRPPVLDGKDQTYGVGFIWDNLDYRLNPRKGFFVSADFGLGKKKVIDNPRLPNSIYNGIQMSMPKKEADIKVEFYQAWAKRQVLKVANHTYWLDLDQYFENDMLQVGGSRDLRGFNENQFFTDLFTQFTIENRFILEKNSFLFVFSDFAYLQNQVSPTPKLRPWSAGLGMAYDTKAGVVSVTYAAGQVGNYPFQPSRGRIHIGLLNQF